ncbi:MAG: choice-of-anchor I family protein [Propionibacteriaceae bacterium]|nr:choice-of-anchor I family protein [Propionibacteriaceae bacterium]
MILSKRFVSALAATACTALLATAGVAAAAPAEPALSLTPVGTNATGIFDASAAEIPAFDPSTNQLFVVNAQSGAVDVMTLDVSGAPTYSSTLSAEGRTAADGSTVVEGAVVNSVSVARGVLAVAVQHADKVQHGWTLFFRTSDLGYLGGVRVGSLPDGLKFSPNGKYVVVANEGEPADDFSTDPEGTISVISAPSNANQYQRLSQASVRTVDFRAFDEGTPLPEGVRVYGPDVKVPEGHEKAGRIARNLEPEYVTITADGNTAFVSLQEANSIAVVDLKSATLSNIWALGYVDWSVDGKLDASDRDDAINMQHWPVKGVLMPDGIATYKHRGTNLIVTANEGDAREWGDFVDGDRLSKKQFVLCDAEFPNAKDLKKNENLGRYNVISDLGFDAERGCYSELYSYGGRGFSIFTADGERLFNSGDMVEQAIYDLVQAGELPESAFNANHNNQHSGDTRSDDKGAEPEDVQIGAIQGRTYAFLGLERIGGVMVFDITDPTAPTYVTYANNRDFSVVYEDMPEAAAAGDLGSEGMVFIPASESPSKTPLLVVANEVSGTTTVWEISLKR